MSRRGRSRLPQNEELNRFRIATEPEYYPHRWKLNGDRSAKAV